MNLNTAYLDAADETDFTSGVNALWRNAELGYIYAHNEIDEFNASTFDAECENDCWITDPGEYDIHTVHASYLIPNVMKMKNFNIYGRLRFVGERVAEAIRTTIVMAVVCGLNIISEECHDAPLLAGRGAILGRVCASVTRQYDRLQPFLIHQHRQIHQTVREAPLVVIPRQDLHHMPANHQR